MDGFKACREQEGRHGLKCLKYGSGFEKTWNLASLLKVLQSFPSAWGQPGRMFPNHLSQPFLSKEQNS